MMIRKPITGRSAWRPSDFASPDAYTTTLTDAHLAVIASVATRRADASRAGLTEAMPVGG